MSELRQALARRPSAERFVYFGEAPERSWLLDSLPPVGRDREGVQEAGVIVVLGVRPTDTCKEVVDGLVQRTVSRERLVELRGPWICTRETIQLALDRVVADRGRVMNIFDLSRLGRLRIKVMAS